MSSRSRINKALQQAIQLPLYSDSKYVIISDCHRGTGSENDNFLKNEFIYLAALNYYFNRNFIYLELGDGDELWENRYISDIISMHPESFEMISKFNDFHRFYGIYGNHDIIKKNPELLPKIDFYPGIVLNDECCYKDSFLIHGHQADFFNSTLWPFTRFLVRYIWKPLEKIGVPDPTSASKNNRTKRISEKKLTRWAECNDYILITGHTHNPMLGTKTSPYFNAGSCVSPAGITCIEIENRCISLVKWTVRTSETQALFVTRIMLGDKVCLDDY